MPTMMESFPPEIIPQERNCLILTLENSQTHHKALVQLLHFKPQCTVWRTHYTETALINASYRYLKEITNSSDKNVIINKPFKITF